MKKLLTDFINSFKTEMIFLHNKIAQTRDKMFYPNIFLNLKELKTKIKIPIPNNAVVSGINWKNPSPFKITPLRIVI